MRLAVKAVAARRGSAMELIRRGASNKAVSTAVTAAGEQAAINAVGGATSRGTTYFTGRKNRRLAMDLARQIGGQVSLRTVIAGERYNVVWRGDEPVESFPTLPKDLGSLAERTELTGFVGLRVVPSPS